MRLFASITLSVALTLAACSFAALAHGAGPVPPPPSTITRGQQQLALSGGVSLRVLEHSAITRLPATALLLSSNRSSTPTHVVRLEEGGAEVHVDAATHAVMVRGPGAPLAVVKSGKALLLLRNGALVVANLEGETLVGSQQGIRPLAAGLIHVATRGATQTRTIRPLAAPVFRLGPRIGLWAGERLTPVQLSWDPIAHAHAYVVELRDASGSLFRRTRVTEPTVSIGDPTTPAGPLGVQVRAVDEFGLPGQPSAVESVTLASVLLPEGAHVDSRGAIRLAPGQHIRFTQARNLELARGELFHWVDAHGAYGLNNEATQKLFIRLAGSHIGIPIHLLPRDVRTDISMEPSMARWPSDPVQIRLRVHDHSGSPPGSLQPVVSVTVGLKPVAASWSIHDGELRAVIPPQPGHGPCVLRVEVRDQHGVVIGRSFLEIDRI